MKAPVLSCLTLIALTTACSVSVGDRPTINSVSIALSPDATSSSIGVGYPQAYDLTVRDNNGKLLPDATGVFSISPDGSCRANVCTASNTGVHVVTATSGGLEGVAYVNVTAGGFDHLGILPRFPQISAGSPFILLAVTVNSHSDPLTDVTTEAVFSISNEGSCAANVCTAFVAHGGQVLTVTQSRHTSRIALQVNAGKMTNISLEPRNATIVARFHETYSATGYDAYKNAVENAYGMTNFAGSDKATFAITPDGSCVHSTCSPSSPGVHTVTITYLGLSATTTLTAV